MEENCGLSAMICATSSAEYSTSAMAPASSSETCCSASPISRERTQITRTASSRFSPPVAYAAATSPIEWPITASGLAPSALRVSMSATWMAKIPTCAVSTP